MFREISDIVSESISIHLKGSVVKSTAKQKDFQSKIKMFRKKIAELKERFLSSDKLLEDLENTFVTAAKKIENKETYVDRIYKHVDILDRVDTDVNKAKAALLQVEQAFGVNFDQASVKNIKEDMIQMINERAAQKLKATILLKRLASEEYPHILKESFDPDKNPSNMMGMIRHYFANRIKRLNPDLENKIVMGKKDNLIITSDKYNAHGKKGVMWTRFIKFKNLPTVDGPINTFLAVTAILYDPKPESDGSLEIPEFNMGKGVAKLTLSFIPKKVRPARLNLDLNTTAVRVIGTKSSINTEIPKLCRRNGIELFPEVTEIAITKDEITKNEELFLDQYNEYEESKENIDDKLMDLEAQHEEKIDLLNEDVNKQIKTLSSRIKKDDVYLKLQKDIEEKKDEISSVEKEISDLQNSVSEKESLVLDYEFVKQYNGLSDKLQKKADKPTKKQWANYNEYLELDKTDLVAQIELLENNKKELTAELKELQDKASFTMEGIKIDVLRETTIAKEKLKKQFENAKNKLLLKVEEPKVSIYFNDVIRRRRFDGGIKIFFPLDFPPTIDSFLKKEIDKYNVQIEELQIALKKTQERKMFSNDEFVIYRQKLYSEQRSKLVKQLTIREQNSGLTKLQKNAILIKFEKDFESESTNKEHFASFIEEKTDYIKAEIESKKDSRAKLIQQDLDKAKRDVNKDGQLILSTKKVKSLPDEQWETKLTKEAMLLLGLKVDYDEGTTSKSKNAGRIRLHREIVPYVPPKEKDNKKYKAADMYCYTYTLLPKEYEDEEAEVEPFLPEIDLKPDSIQESLDSLSKSGNVTISDKEVESGERKVLDNSQKTKVARYNKQWMKDNPNTPWDFDDEGKMVPRASDKDDKIPVSEEWEEEDKPVKDKVIKQKVVNFNKYKGG